MLDDLVRSVVGASTDDPGYIAGLVVFLEECQLFGPIDMMLGRKTYDRDSVLADVLKPDELNSAASTLAVHTLTSSLANDGVTERAATLNNEGSVILA